ncbi:hypothetical protein VNO77_03593 [Canavalia gladiata]|uniref:Uncharacterized protein n=1 Tax=Canavalia gladiata TaxID=3824 RepID=A0AAN9N0M9_CANGL
MVDDQRRKGERLHAWWLGMGREEETKVVMVEVLDSRDKSQGFWGSGSHSVATKLMALKITWRELEVATMEERREVNCICLGRDKAIVTSGGDNDGCRENWK